MRWYAIREKRHEVQIWIPLFAENALSENMEIHICRKCNKAKEQNAIFAENAIYAGILVLIFTWGVFWNHKQLYLQKATQVQI